MSRSASGSSSSSPAHDSCPRIDLVSGHSSDGAAAVAVADAAVV